MAGTRRQAGDTDRDGEEPPRHLHHGRIAEIAGEECNVDGGRHEDNLEVGPRGQEAPQDAQEEVVVQLPLVDLIHDQDLILGQAGLSLDLPQEQPHRQEHDLGGRRACAFEADLVADLGRRCRIRRGPWAWGPRPPPGLTWKSETVPGRDITLWILTGLALNPNAAIYSHCLRAQCHPLQTSVLS